ncbi:MarR family transcriptional regulator [Paenibacillus filicis]|uniref:MarR family transcriptional regulator n=1 Tax=Paenibacillus filicis TaxID=669464 RepID=A0ABU9DG96_9BACL
MATGTHDNLMTSWISFTQIQMHIANKLEARLLEKHNYSLNEFYMLTFISQAPGKKLRLQQLESMIGLSQSAVSRLVSRFEARGCGALERVVCDEDRRSIYTCLTELGQSKLDQATSTFNEALAELFPSEKLAQLMKHILPERKL